MYFPGRQKSHMVLAGLNQGVSRAAFLSGGFRKETILASVCDPLLTSKPAEASWDFLRLHQSDINSSDFRLRTLVITFDTRGWSKLISLSWGQLII